MPKKYMAHLSQSTTESYKKLRHLYYKFWQNLLQITSKIMAAQTFPSYWWLSQIALIFITNNGSFQNYYKLR